MIGGALICEEILGTDNEFFDEESDERGDDQAYPDEDEISRSAEKARHKYRYSHQGQ